MSQLETALGPVPNRWAVAPLRHCVELRNDRTRNDSDLGPLIGLEHVESWTGRLVSRPEDVETAGQDLLFRRDDVLFGKLRPYLAKAHRAQHDGACSAELLVLRPRAIDAGFLTYCLLCPTWVLLIASSTFGSKMPRANWEFIGHQVLPVPSMHEQRAIADFLDRETEKIDTLVAKKQRLIELLQEQRSALISHAVTKGLDPDAPMKDSGVEWLGSVPAGWDVGPLRRFWDVTDCKHKTVTFVDSGVPVASISEVQGMTVDLSHAKQTTETEAEELSEGGRRPCRGDVIISRNATVGEAALVDTDQIFCLGQDVSLIRSVASEQRYLGFQLQSPGCRQQIEALMIGSTFRRINVSRIKELQVLCPPAASQSAIGRFCDDVFRRYSEMLSHVDQAIATFGEYRSALITAAVTGQIDVRTYRREAS